MKDLTAKTQAKNVLLKCALAHVSIQKQPAIHHIFQTKTVNLCLQMFGYASRSFPIGTHLENSSGACEKFSVTAFLVTVQLFVN